jgi:surfeit locus 1 family protein
MKRMAHSKHWIAVGALALAGAGGIGLGRWQLERAELHRDVAASFRSATGLAAIEQPIAARELDDLRYRRIRLHGRYRAGTQILLDNMTFRGQAGYQVLTPLDIGGSRLVLVNRGWVAASPDRSLLPSVALPELSAEIAGRIDRLPRAGLSLKTPAVAAGPLAVLSFPEYDDIEAVLGNPVHPFVVLLDPDAANGFERNWAPAEDRADRSLAYAVQWFGLAALALALAIGTAVRSLRRNAGSKP